MSESETDLSNPEPGAEPTFADLGLSPQLVDAIERLGYARPTAIQQQSIPPALAGRDILGTAQTGTGKTAAFTLPLIQRLAGSAHQKGPRGLVVTPTRELAQQVGAAVARYGATSSIECVVVHGGTSIRGEADELAFGCDVLVATPGRLLDHFERRRVSFDYIEAVILDEADRMLDMGFIDDVRRIVRATPSSRQTSLFSATMPNGVLGLAHEMMKDPVRVSVGLETAAEGIRQVVHPVDWSRKHALLHHLLSERTSGQVLVFTRTRDTASYLSDFLGGRELSVDDLHGGKSQDQRDKSLKRFRSRETRILVATNVAARGLDIRGIEHVFNFDVPEDPRDYVHRVGRTARGEATGEAVTLVSPNDWMDLRDIERLTGDPIPIEEVPGFEPSSPPPSFVGTTDDEEAAVPRSRLTRGIRRR